MPIRRHHLANEDITTEKMRNLEVKTADIGDLQVTTAKIADLNITTGKIADLNVTTDKLGTMAVTRVKTSNVFIQTAAITTSFAFAAAGVERISATVAFTTAFPTGVVPRVFAAIDQVDLHITGITAISETGFTLTLSDTAGVDKTAAVSVVVTYLALAP